MKMTEFWAITAPFSGMSRKGLWAKRKIWVDRWRAGGANLNELMWIGRIIDSIDAALDPNGRAAKLNWSSMGRGPY